MGTIFNIFPRSNHYIFTTIGCSGMILTISTLQSGRWIFFKLKLRALRPFSILLFWNFEKISMSHQKTAYFRKNNDHNRNFYQKCSFYHFRGFAFEAFSNKKRPKLKIGYIIRIHGEICSSYFKSGNEFTESDYFLNKNKNFYSKLTFFKKKSKIKFYFENIPEKNKKMKKWVTRRIWNQI